MRVVDVICAAAPQVRLLEAHVCTNWSERFRGLLRRPEPLHRTALCLPSCRAVHTFGMRYPIDVVFCGADGAVVEVRPALEPGRTAMCRHASFVLELRAGEAARIGLQCGQQVVLSGGRPTRPADGDPPERARLAWRARLGWLARLAFAAAPVPVRLACAIRNRLLPIALLGPCCAAGPGGCATPPPRSSPRGTGLSARDEPGTMTHRQHGRAFRRDQRAAATVEFAIVALLALVPLVLGILQLGLLYAARHTLNHAAFLAARAGAVTNGSRAEMQRYLAKGLVPLYAGAATDLDGGNVGAAVAGAYARAYADVLRPDRTRLRILNPAAASFTDFERRRAGVLEIPNAFDRQRVGQASGQTLADANLLRISVDRCEPLIVPFIDTLLTSALRRLDHDLFRQGCYAARRLPIAASALVHMHTPPRRSVMDPLA